MSDFINIIPTDIFFNIFSRIPIKNVTRLRCVSKSWRNFITTPFLFTLHLHNPTQHPKLLFCNSKSFYTYDYETSSTRKCSPTCHPATAWGSCNGVLFVTEDDRAIFLWNPFTRECMVLPNPGLFRSSSCSNYSAFGVRPITDGYEVVGINSHNGYKDENSQVYVYSLAMASESWKKMQTIPYTVPATGGTLVNGVLHWAAKPIDRARRVEATPTKWVEYNLVIAFKVGGDEECQDVELPYFKEIDFYMGITELRGELCLLCNYKSHVEAWLMKDYGVKDSWTKLFSIREPTGAYFTSLIPLCFTQGRGVLVTVDGTNGRHLVLCDPTEEGLVYLVDLKTDGVSEYKATTYIESEVQIKPQPLQKS